MSFSSTRITLDSVYVEARNSMALHDEYNCTLVEYDDVVFVYVLGQQRITSANSSQVRMFTKVCTQ